MFEDYLPNDWQRRVYWTYEHRSGKFAAETPQFARFCSKHEQKGWFAMEVNLNKRAMLLAVLLFFGFGAIAQAQTWVDQRGNTYEIRNVKKTTVVKRIAPGMYAEGGPGGNLTLSKKTGVSVSVNTGVTVNFKVLSATLGFDVTASVEMSYEYSRPIPAGKRMSVQFYNLYQAYEYEVWMKPLLGKTSEKVGGGTVLQPYGNSFVSKVF